MNQHALQQKGYTQEGTQQPFLLKIEEIKPVEIQRT